MADLLPIADPHLRDFLASLVVRLSPVERFRMAIGAPDRWQEELLLTDPANDPQDQFVMALTGRQQGKSTTTAGIMWDDFCRGRVVCASAPSLRQSTELLRRVLEFKQADPAPPKIIRQTQSELESDNGGRIVCLPATDQARGLTADTVIFDESAYLPDAAITALLPLRKAEGRVIMISTAGARAGFFYETWMSGQTRKILSRSIDIPRLAAKVEYDRRFMSEARFQTEHMCIFNDCATYRLEILCWRDHASWHSHLM